MKSFSTESLSVWGMVHYLPPLRSNFFTLCSHRFLFVFRFPLIGMPVPILSAREIPSHETNLLLSFLTAKQCHACKTYQHHRHAINATNPFKTVIRCVCGDTKIGWQVLAFVNQKLVNSAQNTLLTPSLSLLPLVHEQVLVNTSALQGSAP